MRKKLIRLWPEAIVMVFILALVWYFYPFGPDPRFNIVALRGKTPDEIVQQFGPPIHDRRCDPSDRWTLQTDATAGPLVFGYRDASGFIMDYNYGIVFEQGRVVKVIVSSGK